MNTSNQDLSHSFTETTYNQNSAVSTDVYNDPQLSNQFVVDKGGLSSAELLLYGINCSGCTSKIERELLGVMGVEKAEVNYAARRLYLVWDTSIAKIGDLIKKIRHLGFDAIPWSPTASRRQLDLERKDLLKRLGISGVFGMQVMTIAVALYFGDAYGMNAELRIFLIRVAMVMTLPVLLYGAKPFFLQAFRALRHRQTNMDLTVCLAITLAFVGSAYCAVTGRGHVFFESICMFIFLLNTARFVETNIRVRASECADLLVGQSPEFAYPVSAPGEQPGDSVAAIRLKPDDLIVVKSGDTVPADGVVVHGAGGVSESLITGESDVIAKCHGDSVLAGSINAANPLWIRVTQPANLSALAGIKRLTERIVQSKPAATPGIVAIARFFIIVVIGAAVLSIAIWAFLDPSRILPVTISVLAVACPCALSIAAPAAYSVTANQLIRMRMLPTSAATIETLSKLTDVVFDKTGTLTAPSMQLSDSYHLDEKSAEYNLAVAGALNGAINHPVANAFREPKAIRVTSSIQIDAIELVEGKGVKGTIEGTPWRLGNNQFVSEILPERDLTDCIAQTGPHRCWLVQGDKLVAGFNFQEKLNTESESVIAKLQELGIKSHILSGDRTCRVDEVAQALRVENAYSEVSPQQKSEIIGEMQSDGKVVAMIGDGINDSPALSQADLSIAVSGAASLATLNADLVCTTNRLGHIVDSICLSQRTAKVVQQNHFWALSYNVSVIPLAVAGYIPPWIAAIGMSLSSILVVANAMRLNHGDADAK